MQEFGDFLRHVLIGARNSPCSMKDKESQMNAHIGFEVAGLRKLDGEGKTKAFCDVAICGTLLVRGFRVVEGKNGTFVSMPRRQGKDGQWYETVSPLNDEVKVHLNEIVLEAYRDSNG